MVWPGVSIIFPCNKSSTWLRFCSLTWIHLHWYSCLNLGNKCLPLPASFIKTQKHKANLVVQPPQKEFCPLYKPSNALLLITIWVSAHSERNSFRYPAWSSWACVKKMYRICWRSIFIFLSFFLRCANPFSYPVSISTYPLSMGYIQLLTILLPALTISDSLPS